MMLDLRVIGEPCYCLSDRPHRCGSRRCWHAETRIDRMPEGRCIYWASVLAAGSLLLGGVPAVAAIAVRRLWRERSTS